jgi:hypothetical protein
MVAQAPTLPPTTPNPPDLPSMPQVGPVATDYLRRFSLWCKKALDSKQPLVAAQAQTGIMLVAFDAPAGVTPNVYLLQVNQQGNFVSTPVPLGGGQP